MDGAHLLYCRIATVMFFVDPVYPLTTKLLQERPSNIRLAKAFTWGIGPLYLVFGVYGWLTPGFLLHAASAIPLGVVDNVFHLLLSVWTWQGLFHNR